MAQYNAQLQWLTAGDVDTALRYLAELSHTLDNTTDNRPTLDMATTIWKDAYRRIQKRARKAGWATPITVTSTPPAAARRSVRGAHTVRGARGVRPL